MTLGERLLSLTVEYQRAVDTESGTWDSLPGTNVGRSTAEIASDYEAALRGLLAADVTPAS